jgi:hypothetical protein
MAMKAPVIAPVKRLAGSKPIECHKNCQRKSFTSGSKNSPQNSTSSKTLGETIRARFGDTLEAAAKCELFAWRPTAEGRLAENRVLG